MAAAQADASAIPRLPQISASRGGIPGLERSVPTIAVNTMSATTFGLVSSK